MARSTSEGQTKGCFSKAGARSGPTWRPRAQSILGTLGARAWARNGARNGARFEARTQHARHAPSHTLEMRIRRALGAHSVRTPARTRRVLGVHPASTRRALGAHSARTRHAHSARLPGARQPGARQPGARQPGSQPTGIPPASFSFRRNPSLDGPWFSGSTCPECMH